MEISVVFGNLLFAMKDLKRASALPGWDNGTMWEAPLTVANVSIFPYSVVHPPTYTWANRWEEGRVSQQVVRNYTSSTQFQVRSHT